MHSILPRNASHLELALEETIAKFLEPQAYIKKSIDEIIAGIWDYQNCDETLLPYLAWALGVEIWNDGMTISQKREIIKTYLKIRKLRGTVKSLTLAFEALGVDARIKENADSKDPYFFKLIVGGAIDPKLKDQLYQIIDILKPLRTHYVLDYSINLKTKTGLFSLGRQTQIARYLGEIKNA